MVTDVGLTERYDAIALVSQWGTSGLEGDYGFVVAVNLFLSVLVLRSERGRTDPVYDKDRKR